MKDAKELAREICERTTHPIDCQYEELEAKKIALILRDRREVIEECIKVAHNEWMRDTTTISFSRIRRVLESLKSDIEDVK